MYAKVFDTCLAQRDLRPPHLASSSQEIAGGRHDHDSIDLKTLICETPLHDRRGGVSNTSAWHHVTGLADDERPPESETAARAAGTADVAFERAGTSGRDGAWHVLCSRGKRQDRDRL